MWKQSKQKEFKMASEWKEKLEKRREERLLELERKKEERTKQIRPEENPELLLSTFTEEKKKIEQMLCGLDELETHSLRDRLEEATKTLQQLQKFLTDSFSFLPPYDIKNMQSDISKLQQDMNNKRSRFMPKKKFAFSKKKSSEQSGRMTSTTTSSQNHVDNEIAKNPEFPMTTETSSEKLNSPIVAGQHITKLENDLFLKDVSFSNLKDSTVTLFGSPLALHLQKLESCKVFCGPVSGSVFINDCKDCTFVFPCQQLRVHNTVNSHFYLHVTSRAIVEDCHGLGFAEFNWTYKGIDNHFETSRLDQMKNNWQFVYDFNWLKTEEHSPNWHIINNQNKVNSWD